MPISRIAWRSNDEGPDPGRVLARMLPVVGPAFGACVLVLGGWDYVGGTAQSPGSLLLRLALVGLGAPCYFWPQASRMSLWRGTLIYTTHAAALAAGAVPLADALGQAMPVYMLSMLVAGMVETRPARCLLILLPAFLLYGAAGAATLPPRLWLASAAACTAVLLLALLICSANGGLRRQSWLRERQLLDACRYDSLSRALSRAYVTELACHDIALAQRYRRPLSVAMIDIDHFKRVNDRHGHAAGDEVIRALVRVCLDNVRGSDYVGRIGGEEFVCVMPETAAPDALACAERIRTGFAGQRMHAASGTMSATISIGIAVLAGQPDWDALLRDADAALYRAKEAGRNRTVLAARPPCAESA